ncbi:MAG TPA: hypothetical protein VH394_07255 [Thermoanaerobaculia bacterium]|nr:hypothetical protein [Thermoanaerobaculia bacterium]
MRLAERLRRWFFPPEVELPEHVRQLLRAVYPTLNMGLVRFHLGIPHVFNMFAIQAITLPGKLLPRRSRIYVEPKYWDPGSVDGLGLLLHEAYHALQIQETGLGLGLLRPFLILYLACAAGNRFQYAGHPMEDDAYRVAGDSESRFESTFRNGKEILPDACECMATPTAGLSFWRRLAESTPGWSRAGESLRILLVPWVLLWFLIWTSATAILAILKGLVELLGALVAGGLWLLPG